MAANVAQPAGTVTLVFTDIEGSTRLLSQLGENAYREALDGHRRAVRTAFAGHGGYEVDCEGDSFFYAFASAGAAARAASEAMAALEPGLIRIRVGVHSGEPGLDPPKYVGLDVHRAARIMAAGHGGQVLLSRRTRDLLDDSFVLRDLGDHRLKDLPEPLRLYQLGEAVFPPLRTLHRSTLPVPATALVGRNRELGELGALLRDGARLLTLTGPGGVGKTRLALQAASGAAGAYPGGVWWVPLAPLQEPALVLSQVAVALGIAEKTGSDTAQAVADELGGKRALLLLDNAEHLLPDAATAIAMLRDLEGPTTIVTSRERLQLSGEHVYAVPVLRQSDGVELFADRARTLMPGYQQDAAVSELCARLDNLPLAIELAAARVPVMPAREILERLEHRLDLLRGGRDADPRQQTLRATISWSYDQLAGAEREAFARLAVFAGGCTLDAAERICQTNLETIASLVDKSLLVHAAGRYWLLETLREYASERLGERSETNALRARHAESFARLAETADPELVRASDYLMWLERLELEHENLRAAIGWAVESSDHDLELRLVGSLWRFWSYRGHLREGASRLARALAAGDGAAELRAKALLGAGSLAAKTGRDAEAERLLEQGVAASGGLGKTELTLALLNNLAGVVAEHDEARALRLYEEVARLSAETGVAWPAVFVNLADLALRRRDYPAAKRYSELCLQHTSADARLRGLALQNLAHAQLALGNLATARDLYRESLALFERVGDQHALASTISSLGVLEARNGSYRYAAELLACAEKLFAEVGGVLDPLEQSARDGAFATIHDELGEVELRAARASGAQLDPMQVADSVCS